MIESLGGVERTDASQKELTLSRIIDAKGDYEGDPEIRGLLQALRGPDGNFTLLESVVNRHLAKAQVGRKVEIGALRIIQLRNGTPVEGSSFQNIIMSLNTTEGFIVVNDENVRRAGERMRNVPMLAHHAFIHELVHWVSSRSEHDSEFGRLVFQGVRRVRIRDNVGSPDLPSETGSAKAHVFFSALDEGLTDMVAEDVVREYLQAAGLVPASSIDTFYSRWNSPTIRAEAGRQRLIAAIVRKVAEKGGVPEDVAKEALGQAVLSGFSLLQTDSSGQDVLDEAIGEGFTERLATLSDVVQLNQLIKDYKLEPFFERLISNALSYIAWRGKNIPIHGL